MEPFLVERDPLRVYSTVQYTAKAEINEAVYLKQHAAPQLASYII